MTFKELMKNEFDKAEISADNIALERFCVYKDMLQEQNKRYNLTGDDTDEQILFKHFIDSLTLIPFINDHEGKCIDIGTGAGFPLLPVKIIIGSLDITLVDSVNKKVMFLEKLILELGLDKTNCIHARAEDLGHEKNHRNCYDLAVSRAVAPLNILIEYCAPFLKNEGIMIFMKSEKGKEELDESENALKELNSECEETYFFDMRYENEIYKRMFIKIRQKGKISHKYPRKAGMVKKNPL